MDSRPEHTHGHESINDPESQINYTGKRNTFLSKIFGIQSDDAKRFVENEEMSTFPLEIKETSNNNNNNNNDNITDINDSNSNTNNSRDNMISKINSPSKFIHEYASRIPESDQESSTTVSSPSSLTENIESNSNTLKSQSDIYFTKNEQINDVENESFESVAKVGQFSIYDQFQNNNSKSEDIDNYSDDSKGTQTKNNNHLDSNFINQKYSQYFNKYFNTHTDKKIQEESESFIFQEDNKKNIPKRPSILRHISILNNTPSNKIHTLNAKEKALWKWANIDNLDTFLQDVYNYYLGNGFLCIILQKFLNLLTLLFVVYVSTYLGYCIDYSLLPKAHSWSEISQDQCYKNNITGFIKVLLWIFYIFLFLKLIQLYFDYKNLIDIKNFYNHLLNINDDELQTIPWQNVVNQIISLKDQNALTANVVEVKAKNRISALDIANRIMRKENYLIALFNNNILNLSLPLPLPQFLSSYLNSHFSHSYNLTKTLEWNIHLCIMGYLFNESGFLKQNVLSKSQRQYIKDELNKRFMLAGFLNIVLSPFLVSYFILLYFFKYFNEYKTSPGSIGVRQYTPFAEWRFREYNELYHLFKKRIDSSIPIADQYTNQFPREKSNIIMKFISFISGSFVAILAILTIFDPDYFLNFEITDNKSVLFYLTLFGSIWTISHNSISKVYTVFEPEEKIKELSNYTHYLPKKWEGRYHTEEVKDEFCRFYNLKIILLFKELTSLITTPFILWFSLPKSTDAIIDFFKESSIYVDGLGYVCKFGLFDNIDTRTKTLSNNLTSGSLNDSTADGRMQDLSINEDTLNKMMQSYLYFTDNYDNKKKALGKYQLPQENENIHGINKIDNRYKYSWEKQFKPGRNPRLFQTNLTNSQDKYKDKYPKNTKPYQNDTTNSFIKLSSSSSVYKHKTETGNRLEPTKREGILKLVKEYYEQSNV